MYSDNKYRCVLFPQMKKQEETFRRMVNIFSYCDNIALHGHNRMVLRNEKKRRVDSYWEVNKKKS